MYYSRLRGHKLLLPGMYAFVAPQTFTDRRQFTDQILPVFFSFGGNQTTELQGIGIGMMVKVTREGDAVVVVLLRFADLLALLLLLVES
jgi:hypothetical protein